MTERERFIVLVSNEPLKRADAIVILEGDEFHRLPKALELFRGGWAPVMLISGGIDAPQRGSFVAPRMAEKLVELGAPRAAIQLEVKSTQTREQALEVLSIAAEKGWTRILLVASHYHQFRAYLTFLRVSQERNSAIEIINAPARNLSWFEELPYGTRADLMTGEFQKIEEYGRLGHIATFADALADFERKEQSVVKQAQPG